MNYKILYTIALVVTFAATVGISRVLIPILKSKKMGQKILDIGPRWHKSKEGTPTMGGFAFIIASVVVGLAGCVYFIFTDGVRETLPFVLTLAYGVANGLVGCIDDGAKLRKKQNEGLTPIQKYLLQFIAAAAYLTGMTLVCGANTEVYLPFFGKSVDFGIFYYVLAMLLLTGIVNSVNLTDGIDGLASSITLVVGVFFSCAGFQNGMAEPDGGLILLGALLMGVQFPSGARVHGRYRVAVPWRNGCGRRVHDEESVTRHCIRHLVHTGNRVCHSASRLFQADPRQTALQNGADPPSF